MVLNFSMPSLLFHQVTSEINTIPSLSCCFLKGRPFLKIIYGVRWTMNNVGNIWHQQGEGSLRIQEKYVLLKTSLSLTAHLSPLFYIPVKSEVQTWNTSVNSKITCLEPKRRKFIFRGITGPSEITKKRKKKIVINMNCKRRKAPVQHTKKLPWV